jgi:hypothetical protein
MMTAAQQQLIMWLKQKDPFLYDVAMKNYSLKTGDTGLGGIGDFDFSKFVGSLTSAAAKVASEVANIKVLNANVKRAQSGLPPIPAEAYQPSNPSYQPYTSEGQYAVNYTARSLGNPGFSLTGLLPWAAIGVLGFMLIKRAKRG